MTTPETGVRRHGAAKAMLFEASLALAEIAIQVRDGRLRPRDRDEVSRRLAGVIGKCEGVRLWLGAGAPR